ncbi:MAG: hypothetical protein RMI30_02990 [Thermodesulfovibrio sp.]|nr:hypothetical protein [Thermodesulfovibrio sp.]MDW7998401.1 hypothetical protein [Thermodesulfovibrio sp.]
MNRRNIILLVIFNLIILAELIFSLYEASKDPENVTLIFVQYFILLIIPTFIIGRIILKKLVRRQVEESSQVITKESEEQKALYAQLNEKEELFKDSQILQKPENIKGIIRKRAFLGKLGLLFIIIMAISFLDGCVNRLLHPMNLVNILPGQSINVNAPLEKKVNDVGELSYTSTSDMIRLQFDSIYSGFWVGGTEWRGVLKVDPNIKPGEYKLTINIKENESKKPFVFIVRVHENITSLNRSSMSFITRATGISPWIVFGTSILLIVMVVLLMLKLSNKIEFIMLQNGQAEVFFVRRSDFLTEIAFGLGKKNNIKPGDVLNIYTEKGIPVGKVIVQNSTDENSIGIVKAEYNVKPGFIVAVKK